MKRRNFLETAGMVTAGIMVMKAKTALGYAANSTVRVGLLGCGGRGTQVATSFLRNTTAQVVALADIFSDQIEKTKAHFDHVNAQLGYPTIDKKMLFVGPDAYQKLALADIDLIQISTPPFFHVQHLAAAVAGGKHVYCEKPVGIDIKQARQALEIAKKVGSKQSIDVGFQCRNAPPIAAIAERVKEGVLGKIGAVTGHYFAPASDAKFTGQASKNELRLRNWLWDKALSGDILVEQNIHIIDLCNWIVGAHPVKAVATGGRNMLTHLGDCWDNYQVEFTYPGDVRLSFSSIQFGSYIFDAALQIFGSKGMATVPYSGPIQIKGTQAWSWKDSLKTDSEFGKFAADGNFDDNLAFADREKERSFIASIVDGPAHNQIADGVDTALSTMLGRMAGYCGKEMSWQDLLAHGETYDLGMNLKQLA
jgi:predicted dehydrogenase